MGNQKLRLLLLNPPAFRPVFRDCYCSGPTKGAFFIHPLDLQIQSGYFTNNDFQLEFIDAVFEKQNANKTLEMIKKFRPDTILALVGQHTLENDKAFFTYLKSLSPNIRLFLSGDIARFDPILTFRELPEIDGILMDFGSPGLLEHFNGNDTPDLFLQNETGAPQPVTQKSFQYPLPWKGFVKKYRYRLPFFKEPLYYSIASSFGCPYTCNYCNTHLLGYRTRSIDHFVEELYFASGLGFRSLYVRDATFFFDRERTLHLLKAWAETDLKFQWICFTRPDLIDEELAEMAARLGCCLMMLGVESFDEGCLKDASRNMGLEDIKQAFNILQKFGIQTSAHIIVGMHKPDSHSIEKMDRIDGYEKRLKRFLNIIDPDYISLNLFYPRPGIDIQNPFLNRSYLNREAHQAIAKRINRYFYFRPRTVARQMFAVQSLKQFIFQLKIAANLLLDN